MANKFILTSVYIQVNIIQKFSLSSNLTKKNYLHFSRFKSVIVQKKTTKYYSND